MRYARPVMALHTAAGDHMAGHSYSCIVGEKPSWARGDGGKEFRIQSFLEHADLLH